MHSEAATAESLCITITHPLSGFARIHSVLRPH